jgi:diadenosine tetraphosphate (Ap4A) HIT family hydrolase
MRSAKLERVYIKHLKNADVSSCSFCDINKGHDQFIEATKFFKIIRNRFPYTFWDGQGVSDHLMVVPRRHINSLTTLNDKEKMNMLLFFRNMKSRTITFMPEHLCPL